MAIELSGISIAEKNENGTFSFAEPNPDKTWTIFRTVENGQGTESTTAELIAREQGVIRTAVFRYMQGGRRIRANRLQAENTLRRELGLL